MSSDRKKGTPAKVSPPPEPKDVVEHLEYPDEVGLVTGVTRAEVAPGRYASYYRVNWSGCRVKPPDRPYRADVLRVVRRAK